MVAMADTTTATVMFTDLVGSTALRSRMGEEGADELRRSHDTALSGVVVQHSGAVIKGGGDGLLCTFDSASDALSAAVGMQLSIVELGRSLRLDLKLRIGLSVGDVTIEDDDCFGMPVVEAARLEASARPGQILCTEFVRLMARGRGDHSLTSVGSLTLKGFDEPVAAHEVEWEPPPLLGGARTETPYVGRDPELVEFHRYLDATLGGEGGTILVPASAGMGKSRLIEEFISSVGLSALVLAGVCDEGETAPYAAIATALEVWADRSPDLAQTLLGPQAPVMTTIAPGLTEIIADVGEPTRVVPELEHKRLLDSWERFLTRLVENEAVMLVIDDLHWADQGTLALVRVAAKISGGNRLLVVCAFRGNEIDDDHPARDTLARIQRESDPSVIELAGLEDAAVKELLFRLGGGSEVADDFVELLTTESDGNPLFIRETLLQLVADGRLRQEHGVWVGDDIDTLDLPDVLRHIFMRRVEHLSRDAQTLLGIGALFEASFPLRVAGEVVGLAETDALDAIDEALGAQIIEPAEVFDTYRFTHALFRQALTSSLNPSRRVRLHRSIAEALVDELVGPPSILDAATIAGHYGASAELPGAEAGVPFAVIHGEGSAKAASHLDSLAAYRLARDLLADGGDRLFEIQQSIAVSAALARVDADELVVEAEECVGLFERRADAATFLVDLGRLREEEDSLAAWRLGDLARPLHSGEQDEDWISLRSWELAEKDWRGRGGGGFAEATPERIELAEVAFRMRSNRLNITSHVFADAATAAETARWMSPLHSGLVFAFKTGQYREAIEQLSIAVDSALDHGDNGSALFAVAALGRVRFRLGHQDEADRLIELGATLASKLGDLSNPVFQYAGMVLMNESAKDPGRQYAVGDSLDHAFESLSPDLAWLRGMTLVTSVTTAARDDGPVAANTACSNALDACSNVVGGSPNYPLALYLLAVLADEAGFDPDPRLAPLINDEVLEKGYDYLESDPALALGVLAGLDEAVPEARSWFTRARSRLDANGNRVTRAFVPRYEARMEFRSGFPGGATRFDELVEEAREHLGSLVGFEPRLAELDELVAARDEGRDVPIQFGPT